MASYAAVLGVEAGVLVGLLHPRNYVLRNKTLLFCPSPLIFLLIQNGFIRVILILLDLGCSGGLVLGALDLAGGV